jgi:aspartyl-tRNA(Asn)/glutamyl-tRNA(Gln) amidotransferase subunit A
VAAGLVPFALGSETSGSILTPSAYCGVTGLRPTYGLVSRHGAMALSWTLDKVGPMARSAEDCALVLQTIAGADSQDPGSSGKSFYYAPQFQRAPKEIVVGFAPADFDEWPEASTRAAFQKAFETVKAAGYRFKEVQLPGFPYGPMVSTIVGAEGAAVFEPLIASGKVDELADKRQIENLKAALEIPAKDYLKAMRLRAQAQEAFRQLFVEVDVLLAPTRYNVATPILDPLDKSPFGDRPAPPRQGLNGLIAAGNLAGLPAISLPCGFANNLPVAIQFCTRPFSENLILSMGVEFQKRTDWHRRRPTLS